MFIVSLAFLAVFIFACALTHLVLLQTDKRDFLDVLKMSPISVVVLAICFFSVWSVIGLAGFHTYLTSSDQTTNEDIKGSFSNKGGELLIAAAKSSRLFFTFSRRSQEPPIHTRGETFV
jgi:palmitoyltransferase ZDHHC9/14/18